MGTSFSPRIIKAMKILFICVGIFFCAASVSAQSMLEYGALMSATGAAGAAAAGGEEEEDGKPSRPGGLIGSTTSRIYEQGMQAAADRGSALFGQLGQGMSMPSMDPKPLAPDNVFASSRDVEAAPAEEEDLGEGCVVVVLNSGKVVEGRLIEENADHVRVELAGVVVTFFRSEIASVRPAGEEL